MQKAYIRDELEVVGFHIANPWRITAQKFDIRVVYLNFYELNLNIIGSLLTIAEDIIVALRWVRRGLPDDLHGLSFFSSSSSTSFHSVHYTLLNSPYSIYESSRSFSDYLYISIPNICVKLLCKILRFK